MKSSTCLLIAVSIMGSSPAAMAAINIDPQAYHAEREAEKKARLQNHETTPLLPVEAHQEQKTIEKKAADKKAKTTPASVEIKAEKVPGYNMSNASHKNEHAAAEEKANITPSAEETPEHMPVIASNTDAPAAPAAADVK